MEQVNVARYEAHGGPRTSHEYVRDRLREALVRGDFAGGERLIQNEIADRYGVSTTPVREALRDLATEGLLKFDSRRGAIVRGVSAEEFDDVYEMRLVLEPLAVRRGIERITDEELARAREVLTLSSAERDAGRWAGYNREFHSILEDAARSTRICAVLGQLRDLSSLYIGYVLRSDSEMLDHANEQHEELLVAYEQRDIDRALLVAQAHLENTRRAGVPSAH